MKLSPFKRGDTWKITFVWKNDGTPIDITGCHARMQIRKKRVGTLLAEISDDDDSITIVGASGEVNVAFPASITALVDPGVHETSLQLTYPSGEVQSSDSIDIPVIEAVTR